MARGYIGFAYNIDDEGLIRSLYGRGSALHTVRGHLTSLHAWADKSHHVGCQLLAICGDQHEVLRNATSRRTAALKLRSELLARLSNLQTPDPAHEDLRKGLITTLNQAGTHVEKPFGQTFRYVDKMASDWFGDRWPDDVLVLIEALGGQPYLTRDFWLNAKTVFHSDNTSGETVVHLRINPEELNFETFSAIFAIIVHEFVCHVPAAAKAPNSSPFSEGFCDWAALHLFIRWLDHFDAAFRDAARQFGESIWALGRSKLGGNSMWAPRSFGHLAAEHVVDVFRPVAGRDTAINLTILLARELTTSDADLVSKDNFVRGLGKVDAHTRTRLLRWHERKITADELLQQR